MRPDVFELLYFKGQERTPEQKENLRLKRVRQRVADYMSGPNSTPEEHHKFFSIIHQFSPQSWKHNYYNDEFITKEEEQNAEKVRPHNAAHLLSLSTDPSQPTIVAPHHNWSARPEGLQHNSGEHVKVVPFGSENYKELVNELIPQGSGLNDRLIDFAARGALNKDFLTELAGIHGEPEAYSGGTGNLESLERGRETQAKLREEKKAREARAKALAKIPTIRMKDPIKADYLRDYQDQSNQSLSSNYNMSLGDKWRQYFKREAAITLPPSWNVQYSKKAGKSLARRIPSEGMGNWFAHFLDYVKNSDYALPPGMKGDKNKFNQLMTGKGSPEELEQFYNHLMAHASSGMPNKKNDVFGAIHQHRANKEGYKNRIPLWYQNFGYRHLAPMISRWRSLVDENWRPDNEKHNKSDEAKKLINAHDWNGLGALLGNQKLYRLYRGSKSPLMNVAGEDENEAKKFQTDVDVTQAEREKTNQSRERLGMFGDVLQLEDTPIAGKPVRVQDFADKSSIKTLSPALRKVVLNAGGVIRPKDVFDAVKKHYAGLYSAASEDENTLRDALMYHYGDIEGDQDFLTSLIDHIGGQHEAHALGAVSGASAALQGLDEDTLSQYRWLGRLLMEPSGKSSTALKWGNHILDGSISLHPSIQKVPHTKERIELARKHGVTPDAIQHYKFDENEQQQIIDAMIKHAFGEGEGSAQGEALVGAWLHKLMTNREQSAGTRDMPKIPADFMKKIVGTERGQEFLGTLDKPMISPHFHSSGTTLSKNDIQSAGGWGKVFQNLWNLYRRHNADYGKKYSSANDVERALSGYNYGIRQGKHSGDFMPTLTTISHFLKNEAGITDPRQRMQAIQGLLRNDVGIEDDRINDNMPVTQDTINRFLDLVGENETSQRHKDTFGTLFDNMGKSYGNIKQKLAYLTPKERRYIFNVK